MIDETTGGLVYELKKAGELGPGSAFTVRLEVRSGLGVVAVALVRPRAIALELRSSAGLLHRHGVLWRVLSVLSLRPLAQPSRASKEKLLMSVPSQAPTHPQVDYKRPMPASADVVCSARVESVEGRKVGRDDCLPACLPDWLDVLSPLIVAARSRSAGSNCLPAAADAGCS